jgi:hypothetical protein
MHNMRKYSCGKKLLGDSGKFTCVVLPIMGKGSLQCAVCMDIHFPNTQKVEYISFIFAIGQCLMSMNPLA